MTDASPDSLPADLREHIFRTYTGTPAAEYKLSHWVMSLEWFNETRRLDASPGRLYEPGRAVSAPEFLLGIPVEVRKDGGPPHLELNA